MPTSNNRAKIQEANSQQLQKRLLELTSTKNDTENPITDIIDKTDNIVNIGTKSTQTTNDNKADDTNNTNNNENDLSSLQDRFGVRKINRPVKDAQLTARIDSKTLKRFKEIVKHMYYPDKPNINETVTQIIRAFVEEFDKNNTETKAGE